MIHSPQCAVRSAQRQCAVVRFGTRGGQMKGSEGGFDNPQNVKENQGKVNEGSKECWVPGTLLIIYM